MDKSIKIVKGVTLKVNQRDDGRYTISFIGGGQVFKFTVDDIEAVAGKLATLDKESKSNIVYHQQFMDDVR